MNDAVLMGIFGSNVRARRKRINLTQAELAAKVGLSTSFVTEIETGRKQASFASIAKIADCLNVPVWVLFYKEDLKYSENAVKDINTFRFALKENIFNAIDRTFTEMCEEELS